MLEFNMGSGRDINKLAGLLYQSKYGSSETDKLVLDYMPAYLDEIRVEKGKAPIGFLPGSNKQN